MGVKAWEDAALRALEFYLTRPATFDISVLTHYSAYITDGAIEMGASADVEGFARRIFLEQRPDGAIPALPGRAGWVCMSGVAQWAILGCKLGYRKEAEAALAYLGRTQELSGGFKGSTGRGAAYFPKDEVSWTVKFFLDAVHLFKGRTVSAGAPDREGLSPAQWHAAITGGVAAEALASRLRSGDIPAWCRPLLEQTAPGETVLELGSGAGELSAVMALYGRKVKLLDVSTENLAYARQVFAALGLEAEYIEADALKGIPLAEKSVDWVSSSGLLEHFNDDEVGALIRDSVRVCRRGVISLVPNARSLPYRAGKSAMEKSGAWPWGRERPAYSMRRFFEQAGLGQVEERTVAPYHALSFSRAPEPFREFYTTLSPDELSDLGQGYLLVTYGTR
jgi:ubiquinone/menaquinone biosynthesis C-methylase UbiE